MTSSAGGPEDPLPVLSVACARVDGPRPRAVQDAEIADERPHLVVRRRTGWHETVWNAVPNRLKDARVRGAGRPQPGQVMSGNTFRVCPVAFRAPFAEEHRAGADRCGVAASRVSDRA